MRCHNGTRRSSSSESYGVVMKELLSDLSGPENATQPCSDLTLLPALCHHDDLTLVGPAFGSLGRGSIEEKVSDLTSCLRSPEIQC